MMHLVIEPIVFHILNLVQTRRVCATPIRMLILLASFSGDFLRR